VPQFTMGSPYKEAWKGFEARALDSYTLRYLAKKRVPPFFECCKCEKRALIDVIAMIDLYGSATTLGELRSRARFSRCQAGILLNNRRYKGSVQGRLGQGAAVPHRDWRVL
jgi:hypothetical protein